MTLVRGHRHRDVEPVHEADPVRGEVAVPVVEVHLRQRGGRGPAEAVTLEAVAAIAGGAGESGSVVVAVCAGPYAARPWARGGGEGAVGEFFEGETATFEDRVAGVWLDCGPDGEGAVVD